MLDLQQIYSLLPAVYRIRDAEIAQASGTGLEPIEQQELDSLIALGSLTPQELARRNELQDKAARGPLKSLIAVIAEQIEVLEESLLQSYDDLFIETCQEWVVPYIGDLVGVRGLWDAAASTFSLRAAVADTIADRRRKGTVSVLETLAEDVTGWHANVVEFLQLLTGTQFMNHIRPSNLSMVDIRKASSALLNTPFDPYAHRVEVRNIEKRLGKYNIPNIGVFVWRIAEQKLENSTAFRLDDRRYLFDAIGHDTQLFTLPATLSDRTQRVSPLNVPMPISRRMLLQNFASYYGPGLSIFIHHDVVLSPPDGTDSTVCDLSDVLDASGHVTGWAHQPDTHIAIDPVLGRIAFPSMLPAPSSVHVDYFFGFSEHLGGGDYSRPDTLVPDERINIPGDATTIQDALNLANTRLAGSQVTAIIEIANSEYFVETPLVSLAAGKTVELRAKDGFRPALALSGDMNISGDENSTFRLDGFLLIGGTLVVPQSSPSGPSNLLAQLQISNCTLAPCDTPAIQPTATGKSAPAQPAVPRIRVEIPSVSLSIDSSIVGSLRVAQDARCSISNSIVDSQHPVDIAYAGLDSSSAGAALTVNNSTVIGKVHAGEIALASNTLFVAELATLDSWTAPILADQLQQGCVRFCYVPADSRVPRPYRCHPSKDDSRHIVPAFTSLRFGDPGYCQLAQQSGVEILQGADDGSEMGVFHDLYQPQRLANLRTSLNDYLRFGLQAGIFYAS
jgi:hypothetical protein